MNIFQDSIIRLGRSGLFLFNGLGAGLLPPYKLEHLFKQILFIGSRSMLVIMAAGLCVGMVIALLFYDTLVRFGSVSMLGSAVGLSLVWELGPVLTALMIIGRCGSAICAEISIMRSDNQIDALECMAIDPFRYLIAPRLYAGILCFPILTAIFITTGIFGGYIVGVVLHDVSPGSFFLGMYQTVTWNDLFMCTVKSFSFGLLIIWIATAKGFYMHLNRAGAFGPEGVSRVTTDAVVLSSISILYADYVISALIH